MNDPASYIQPAVTVAAFWALLKFMVVDKLKVLADHEKRIRRQENVTSYLKGKGCLMGDSCPMAADEEEEQ